MNLSFIVVWNTGVSRGCVKLVMSGSMCPLVWKWMLCCAEHNAKTKQSVMELVWRALLCQTGLIPMCKIKSVGVFNAQWDRYQKPKELLGLWSIINCMQHVLSMVTESNHHFFTNHKSSVGILLRLLCLLSLCSMYALCWYGSVQAFLSPPWMPVREVVGPRFIRPRL
jgi:hypothetical protein